MAAVSWKRAVSANWTVAADWSSGAVPTAASDVTIGVAGSYTVSLTTAAAVNSITVSDFGATLAIAAPGTTEAVTKTLSNSGTVEIDGTGTGGTRLTIGGTLANSGVFSIGHTGLGAATTVTAATIANTGTVDITGGTTAQATLEITGATPASLTGDYVLQGNALLEVPSAGVNSTAGGVTSIAGNAELVLDGAGSRVAQSNAATSNSALTKLASNAGTLAIQLGSSITTGGALVNTGLIEVDKDIFGTGDAGGSSLKIGGALTNKGDLDIGNGGLATAATVTATALSNTATGTINLTGGTAQASLDITGAAPSTLTGYVFLQGDALLEFGSGHVTAIAANSELSLDGAQSRVALGNAASNTALTLLATNDGTLYLLDHASVAVTATTAFNNFGTIDVDAYGNGGSQLVLAGKLVNIGDVEIGSDTLVSAAQLTATGLTDSGTIYLTGSAGRATLDITGAAFPTVTNTLELDGNALLEFASGSITSIASGGTLVLDGPRARIALNSDPTASGALSGLARNAGYVSLYDGASVTTTVGFTNTGATSINSSRYTDFLGDGGSSLTIGGTLTNDGGFDVGNPGITAATLVTATGLANTGQINLQGNTDVQSTLNIKAAAPAIFNTGSYYLSGDALLEFAGGAITAIASNSTLSLDGSKSRVALSTATGSNSALTTLASNAGYFALADGASLSTTVNLTNTNAVEVDATGGGGSTMTVGKALTNSDSLDIGNSAISSPTTVTATTGLTNTGTIDLTGGTALATLDVKTAAPATLRGGIYDLTGDALLEFAGGGITTIGGGTTLSLDGASSRVALSTAPGSNSALTALATNYGTLVLETGAVVKTTVGFTNHGTVDVDNGYPLAGGSSLTIGGGLTNSSSKTIDIGNSGITAAAKVGATAVSNAGTIDLTSGIAAAMLTDSGGFTNSGRVELDDGYADIGGGNIAITGALTNSGSFDIGNSTLTKLTEVTAAGLTNTGTINLSGGIASGDVAELKIAGAAPASLAGTVELDNYALLSFANGGISTIGSGANLTLNGAHALIAAGNATTSNSALTALATNDGIFVLENGALVSTTVGFTNNGTVEVDDDYPLAGGSSLTIGGGLTNSSSNTIDIGNSRITAAAKVGATAVSNSGTINLTSGMAAATLTDSGMFTNSGRVELDDGYADIGGGNIAITGALTNSGTFDIGNSALTKLTEVTAAGLTNTGTINLTGGTASGDVAELRIAGAAPASLAGTVELGNYALLSFANGGIATIGSGANLTLNGAHALIAAGNATTSNSALTALATNDGTFILENGALVSTTVGFTDNGITAVDGYTSSGGSSLTIGGGLTNSIYNINIGNSAITAAVKVGATAVSNSGTIDLTSGAAAATLTDSGGFTNSGTVELDNGYADIGGGNIAITGVLTNSGSFYIGNSALTKLTEVTAAGLTNTYRIYLTGGTASGDVAELKIAGAAPASLAGTVELSNYALLSFANGGIATIGSVANLTLDGTHALIAAGNATGSNSALTALATNDGTFVLLNGAVVATTAGFTNNGTVEIDYSYGDNGGSGGSLLTIGGALTNSSPGTIAIGDSGITAAAKVGATAVSNSGLIYLTSGMAAATLTDSGGFTNSGRVELDNGYSLIGGGNIAITGVLTNSGSLDIGNGPITRLTEVTAAGLTNTGTINLNGGIASGDVAELKIGGAAPASLAGAVELGSYALLSFANGGIATIGSGANLTLNGAHALIAAGNATGSNSALTTLATNDGTFVLENGAVVATTAGFTNNGTVEVDSDYSYDANGGSSLTIGGGLTNSSSKTINIGNSGITAAAKVGATAVSNSGTINLTSGIAAAMLTDSGGFTNSGRVDDGYADIGGDNIAITGVLTNSGTFNIGNSALTNLTEVTAAGLTNTGTINLTGGAASGDVAELKIAGAAPASLAGTVELGNYALLSFANGGIATIGSGANLTLNRAHALIAAGNATTSNSALTALATNDGTFVLENGALVSTTVGFTNNGITEVDSYPSSGGSRLTIGGALTNNSSDTIDIGNDSLTGAAKVSAASLANSGSIYIYGGSGSHPGTLSLTGASSDAGSITVNAGGVVALGNTFTVAGSLVLDGGAVSGGTLATSGSGVIETGYYQTGSLNNVTIAAGTTVTAEFGSTLTDNGVTVNGSLNGSGSATLDFAKTGTDSLTNVSGFTTIGLANGAANTLTLATANFNGTAGVITINDGNSGNTVSGAALTSADAIIVHAGTGADALTGGAGSDVFYADGDTTMTGKGGANEFVFTAPGASNTIADFATSATNELVFSNSGFSLGLSGASSTPQALSASQAATLFTSNTTGTFANTSQRLAYDTTNHELFSSADGSGSTRHLVATLTDHASIAASQLFFIT